MAVYALTSIAGAPGVTTAAIAWAYQGPRPTVVIEADVTGGPSIVPTVWKGQKVDDISVLDLAGRDPEHYPAYLWEHALLFPETTDRWVLPTLSSPAAAGSLAGVWAPLADALAVISATAGVDVVIDAGRLGTPGGPWPLIERADAVLVFTDSTLAALARTQIGVAELREALARTGSRDRIAVVPIVERKLRPTETLRPYSGREIQSIFEPTRTVAGLPRDEKEAMRPEPRKGFLQRSTPNPGQGSTSHYGQAVRALIASAQSTAQTTKDLMGVDDPTVETGGEQQW